MAPLRALSPAADLLLNVLHAAGSATHPMMPRGLRSHPQVAELMGQDVPDLVIDAFLRDTPARYLAVDAVHPRAEGRGHRPAPRGRPALGGVVAAFTVYALGDSGRRDWTPTGEHRLGAG